MWSDLLTAVVLGVVEGITEYLPISSTGHLIIVSKLISFAGARAETFEIFIQLGAILAVAVLYKERFSAMLHLVDREAQFGVAQISFACLPALILGALLHHAIKTYLFSTYTVALALLVGGIAMICIERLRLSATVAEVRQISFLKAFFIGCFQCLALWPGMSRSASTIVGGMLCGLTREAAAQFSFLIAVPIMCAAVGYDLLKSYKILALTDLPLFAVGTVVSFVVAAAAIKFLLAVLNRWTLAPFGYYRVVLAALLLLFTAR